MQPPEISTSSSPNTSVAVAPAGVLLAVWPSTIVSTTQVVSASERSGSATSRSVSTSSVSALRTVSVGPSSRQEGRAPSRSASHSSCAWRGASQPISVMASPSPTSSLPWSVRTGPVIVLQPAVAISRPSSVKSSDTRVSATRSCASPSTVTSEDRNVTPRSGSAGCPPGSAARAPQPARISDNISGTSGHSGRTSLMFAGRTGTRTSLHPVSVHSDRVVVCDHVEGVVSSPAGPYYGPLAHGFACGAHIPVHISRPWNALDDPVRDYHDDRESLAESWGVTTTEDWHRQVDYLLQALNVGPEVDAVLHVRRELLGRDGHYDLPTWRGAAEDRARRQRPPGGVAEMVASVDMITRYEARFQADGILPPGGVVSSVSGYDFGRAVSMARWGFGARFCDRHTAESVVLRAGELCRRRYSSWADFSAGYALGRVIRFDNESFGHMYQSVRGPHHLLTTDRSSPWGHLPFS